MTAKAPTPKPTGAVKPPPSPPPPPPRRRTAASELLRRALAVGEAHPFIAACRLAGVEPTLRQARQWRRGEGRALEAAWKRWPGSKSLPRLAGGSR